MGWLGVAASGRDHQPRHRAAAEASARHQVALRFEGRTSAIGLMAKGPTRIGQPCRLGRKPTYLVRSERSNGPELRPPPAKFVECNVTVVALDGEADEWREPGELELTKRRAKAQAPSLVLAALGK